MNPAGQDINALLVMLPKIWKVEDRVAGTDLGFGRFQFDFVEEEDIEAVLKMQPYHFDYWMIALARWQPKMPRDFPSEIPFWIKVLGVPLEFWDVATFQSIGEALGETVEVDLDYGKIKVVVDGRKELCFDTTVDFVGGEFHGGDEALISLKYEKLFGYCGTCFSLSHDKEQCPLTAKSPPKKKEIRELPLARQEDRARSYKGVVINGEGEQQVKGKDHRDFYGKGKGKMYEEQESKWVKVPERGNFRNQGHRNNQRGDDGGYRYRGDRGDRTRRYGTVNNFNAARGVRRGASPRTGAAEDAREEGEIPHQDHRAQRLDDELSLSIPLQGNAAQVDDPKVNSVLESEENGLDVVNEFLETENNKGEEDSMELGDEQVNLEGDDGEDVENASGEENFQNLTDGEVEESNDQIDDTLGDIKEDDITVGGMEEKEAAAGEEDKKKGARRGLIKPSLVAGGSTKARMVQAYISNRKRTSTKPVNRNGEGSKQQEEQGTSKPKPHSTKP